MKGRQNMAAAPPTIEIRNFVFNADMGGDPFVITAGQTVVWHNNDAAPHSAVGDTIPFATKKLNQGDTSAPITFSTPMVIDYHCDPHLTMKGRIIVAAPGSVPDSEALMRTFTRS
jgi:plastocyanin